MKLLTEEWVSKAEGDFATAEKEFTVTANPNYDAVCFHAQQCAEKYLKARLQEADARFGKTHDLSELLEAVLPLEPDWVNLRADLDGLTEFAVDYRYPGELADKQEAKAARERCRKVRLKVRQALAPPTDEDQII